VHAVYYASRILYRRGVVLDIRQALYGCCPLTQSDNRHSRSLLTNPSQNPLGIFDWLVSEVELSRICLHFPCQCGRLTRTHGGTRGCVSASQRECLKSFVALPRTPMATYTCLLFHLRCFDCFVSRGRSDFCQGSLEAGTLH